MGKIDDPKISKPIIRDPEPAGTPIERKDPPDNDKGEPGKSEIARGRQLRTKTGSFAHSGHGVDGMSSVAIRNFLQIDFRRKGPIPCRPFWKRYAAMRDSDLAPKRGGGLRSISNASMRMGTLQ